MGISWEKVGRAVADAAPILGSLAAGPAGGAVGALIAQKLGTASDPEAVLEAMKADPNALLKIKQIEQDERESLRNWQTMTLQAELADVQNARAAHKDHWMPSVLTIILGVIVVVMGGGLFAYPIPPENKEIAVYIFGSIVTLFSSAVTYWIGTSRSSHNKDKMLGIAQG